MALSVISMVTQNDPCRCVAQRREPKSLLVEFYSIVRVSWQLGYDRFFFRSSASPNTGRSVAQYLPAMHWSTLTLRTRE